MTIFRRCISLLPAVEGGKPEKKTFKNCPISYFHIDLAEVRTAKGKLYFFVAIDRTSKFIFVRSTEKAARAAASAFLIAPIKAVPCKIRTVLTDDGISFRSPSRCGRQYAIDHRSTTLNHPGTNGQVER